MKCFQCTTSEHIEHTLRQTCGWLVRLQHLHQRLHPYFARPEAFQHALLYLQALLSDIPRKNGWQIAEQARQERPYGMQRLLSAAVWDHEGCRDELRSFVFQSLLPGVLSPLSASACSLFPIYVLDESGCPKRGRHSAGVARQYCGISGRVENCQVGVFLSYVTAAGHALIDRELYLPEEWCADLPRRRAAHIPDTLTFQTKPELALRMLERARAAGLPARWVVADTVYGHSPQLRTWLEEHGYAYALAVPSTEAVCVHTRAGILLADVASIARHALRPRDWHTLSASEGTKGERLFDWARLPLVHAGAVDGRHFLVLRRCLDDPDELAYYLVWAPQETPLSLMVQAIGARWHIEEDLQLSKALGLDQSEGRSYQGWYRHLTLVLLACAFLRSLCLHTSEQLSASDDAASPPLIALTPCEARRLLAHLFFPAPSSAPFLLHWSFFRRTHQYWAGYYHRRRRAKIGSVPLGSRLLSSTSSREFSPDLS